MVTEIWVNIGSSNGLLPDGTKPLPEQIWLIISKVLGHLSEDIIIERFEDTNQ